MKIATFGELLLRLSPPLQNRFLQADEFSAYYGGAEANVAVLLAQLGEQVQFISKLPENEIAQNGINALRRFGVDTGKILRGGDRMGIYFLEQGTDCRGAKVIYDRAFSAFSQLCFEELAESLCGIDHLHLSGITAAVLLKKEGLCEMLLKKVKEQGATVSLDLNYRATLWSREVASKELQRLMPDVDILIGNEEHIQSLLGVSAKGRGEDGELTREGYKELVGELTKKYGEKTVAITMRRSISAEQTGFFALLSTRESIAFSKVHTLTALDRVGSGDSFSGGLLYALFHDYDIEKAVNFAAAACALKHTVRGDFPIATNAEIEEIAFGKGKGQILR